MKIVCYKVLVKERCHKELYVLVLTKWASLELHDYPASIVSKSSAPCRDSATSMHATNIMREVATAVERVEVSLTSTSSFLDRNQTDLCTPQQARVLRTQQEPRCHMRN